MMGRIVLLLALMMGTAEAGPWCGGYESWTENATVPAGGMVVRYVRHRWYDGRLEKRAKLAPVTATLDGKRVSLRTRTTRTVDGLLQWITLPKRTGHLEVSETVFGEVTVVASYTLVDDWTRPDAVTATPVREPVSGPMPEPRGSRRDPTKVRAALHLSTEPIALTVKSKRGTFHVVPDERVAGLGKIACGFAENIPVADLEAGTKLTVTAILADGSKMPVEGLDSPFVLPPMADEP